MLLATLVLARVVAEAGHPVPVVTSDEVLLVARSGVALDPCVGSDAGVPCTPITGDAVTMIVRPRAAVLDNGVRFAVLFVTPSRPLVEVTGDPFPQLAALAATRTEFIDREVEDPALGRDCTGGDPGCGGNWAATDPGFTPPPIGDATLGDGGLAIETVGPYEIVRAEPADPAELGGWLTSLGYVYADDDLAAVAPYIARHYSVVAVRLGVDHATAGELSPLALTWAGSELRLALPGGASDAPQPIQVYVAANDRFDLPDATVDYAERTNFLEAGFVTRSEIVVQRTGAPDTDPVAIREGTDVEVIDTRYTERTIRVPVHDCNEGADVGCGCTTARPPRGDLLVILAAVGLVMRPRRRRR